MTGKLPIHGMNLVLSPQTSINAVDDGSNLYCFYTSNDNVIELIQINDGESSDPEHIASPTLRSAVAAVLPKPGKIVLFYQDLNVETRKIELYAMTLTKPANPLDHWTRSKPIALD